LTKLWEKLGEQKIDIILERDPKRDIEKIAKNFIVDLYQLIFQLKEDLKNLKIKA